MFIRPRRVVYGEGCLLPIAKCWSNGLRLYAKLVLYFAICETIFNNFKFTCMMYRLCIGYVLYTEYYIKKLFVTTQNPDLKQIYSYMTNFNYRDFSLFVVKYTLQCCCSFLIFPFLIVYDKTKDLVYIIFWGCYAVNTWVYVTIPCLPINKQSLISMHAYVCLNSTSNLFKTKYNINMLEKLQIAVYSRSQDSMY